MNLSSCSAAVTDVGGEVYAVRLGCPASSSARPHDSPRVARLDGQGVASLDGYGDGGVDRVGEGVMGGEGEVVLACEAELIDELFCVFADASRGLHCEGDEVSELSRRHLEVVGLLLPCCTLSYREATGAGKREI